MLKQTLVTARRPAGFLAGVLVWSLAVSGPTLAQDQQSCLNSGMKKITVLGTSPISKSPIETREELVRFLDSIRADVDPIMERKGLHHYTDEMLDALRTGEGVTETTLDPGDVVDWMIFRKDGKVAVGPGPYCLATKRAYPAFGVALVADEEMGDSIRRTTATFIIPKVCANLAYVGTTTETVAKPAPPPVEPERSVAPPPLPPPPPPPPVAPTVEPEPMVESAPDWDSRWTLRAFPLRLDANNDTSDTVAVDFSQRTSLLADGGNGFGASAEYRPSSRWGVEAAVLAAEVTNKLVYDTFSEWLMAEDDAQFLALTVGPNLHLTPNSRADVFVGAFVGLAQFGDPEFALGGTVGSQSRKLDDEVLLGLQAGVDIPIGAAGWALHLSGRYIDVAASGPGTNLDLNPLIGAIGLAYNF